MVHNTEEETLPQSQVQNGNDSPDDTDAPVTKSASSTKRPRKPRTKKPAAQLDWSMPGMSVYFLTPGAGIDTPSFIQASHKIATAGKGKSVPATHDNSSVSNGVGKRRRVSTPDEKARKAAMPWIQATKQYFEERQKQTGEKRGKIPTKGTPEHARLMKIYESKRSTAVKV